MSTTTNTNTTTTENSSTNQLDKLVIKRIKIKVLERAYLLLTFSSIAIVAIGLISSIVGTDLIGLWYTKTLLPEYWQPLASLLHGVAMAVVIIAFITLNAVLHYQALMRNHQTAKTLRALSYIGLSAKEIEEREEMELYRQFFTDMKPFKITNATSVKSDKK